MQTPFKSFANVAPKMWGNCQYLEQKEFYDRLFCEMVCYLIAAYWESLINTLLNLLKERSLQFSHRLHTTLCLHLSNAWISNNNEVWAPTSLKIYLKWNGKPPTTWGNNRFFTTPEELSEVLADCSTLSSRNSLHSFCKSRCLLSLQISPQSTTQLGVTFPTVFMVYLFHDLGRELNPSFWKDLHVLTQLHEKKNAERIPNVKLLLWVFKISSKKRKADHVGKTFFLLFANERRK